MRKRENTNFLYFLSAEYSGKEPRGSWRPNVDIYETDMDVVVALEVPGVLPEDLDISECEHGLVIRGVRRAEPAMEPRRYHQIEMMTGEFEKEVILAGPLRGAPVEATLARGVLSVKIDKKAAGRTVAARRITIEAK